MPKSTGQLAPATVERLRALVAQSERTSGPRLSIDFVRTVEPVAPPLVRLLRGDKGDQGGRGGEVRLKLWLTLHLLAARSPHHIHQPRPTRVWARTLGLPNPDGRGARRVGDAIEWLHDHKFVVAERQHGRPARIEVVEPAPGKPHRASAGRWVIAPVALWEQGWIVTLSAAAIVAFLQLSELTSGGKKLGAMDTARRKEYGISEDTWSRASAELVEAGLLTLDQDVIDIDYVIRRRRIYNLHIEKLKDGPATKLGLK